MLNDKIGRFSLILFSSITNYMFIIYFIVPNTIDVVSNNGYYIPLIYLAFFFILFVLVRKRINPIHKPLSKRVCQLFFMANLVITLSISTHIATEFSFQGLSSSLYLFLILFVVFLLTIKDVKGIIHVGNIFMVFIFIVFLVPLLTNYDILELKLVLPFKVEISFVKLFFYYAFLFFDVLFYLFISNNLKHKIKASHLITSFAILMVLSFLYIFYAICIFGTDYFKGYQFIGLNLFISANPSKYIGQYSFFSCFFIPAITCFKASFLLRNVLDAFCVKRKIMIFMNIIVLFLALSFFQIEVLKNIEYLIYFACFIGICFYLSLWRKKNE